MADETQATVTIQQRQARQLLTLVLLVRQRAKNVGLLHGNKLSTRKRPRSKESDSTRWPLCPTNGAFCDAA